MLRYRNPHHRHLALTGEPPWRQVATLILGVGGITAVLITGLVLSLPGVPSQDNQLPRGDVSTVSNAAGSTQVPSEKSPIILPAPSAMGPGGVATGYPQTAEGALAQLAAIDLAISKRPRSWTPVILRAWSTQPSRVDTFLKVSTIDDHLHSLQRGNARDPRLWFLGTFNSSQNPVSQEVCLAVAVGEPVPATVPVHCEVMAWDAGHWAIDQRRTVKPPLSTLKTLAQASQAGLSPLQGAAEPGWR
ncbi:hypothetical protein Kisp01_69850 [Kineosporia sp. NBRC 101677]|uniref:hypothetical protein n=1 Tax=Kineosporia sp. NBRC 101677 TaxID=3032197 RepID=UPI0024A1410D|nr:hypothetical protein [Kineosporia sp. NBRC 101677]GLY19971.1 hypothetical protein Kisp01_69850 [Kineosporia sp. NBRC 101677]